MHSVYDLCILSIVRRTKKNMVTGSDPESETPAEAAHSGDAADAADSATEDKARPAEIGGPEGPEPTRYGDWEKNGRCIDF